MNKDSNVQGDMRASITLVYFAYLGIRIYLSVCCSVFSALPSSCKSCFQLNFPIKAFTRVDNNDEQGVIKARGHGLVSQFAGTCQPCWQLSRLLNPSEALLLSIITKCDTCHEQQTCSHSLLPASLPIPKAIRIVWMNSSC